MSLDNIPVNPAIRDLELKIAQEKNLLVKAQLGMQLLSLKHGIDSKRSKMHVAAEASEKAGYTQKGAIDD